MVLPTKMYHLTFILLELKHKTKTLSEGPDEAWGKCDRIATKFSCAAFVSLESTSPESLGIASQRIKVLMEAEC